MNLKNLQNVRSWSIYLLTAFHLYNITKLVISLIIELSLNRTTTNHNINCITFLRIFWKLRPNIYRKKLLRMLTLTTYFKVIKIDEAYPFLYNYPIFPQIPVHFAHKLIQNFTQSINHNLIHEIFHVLYFMSEY